MTLMCLLGNLSPSFSHVRCMQPCQIGDTSDNNQQQHCKSLNCGKIVNWDWSGIIYLHTPLHLQILVNLSLGLLSGSSMAYLASAKSLPSRAGDWNQKDNCYGTMPQLVCESPRSSEISSMPHLDCVSMSSGSHKILLWSCALPDMYIPTLCQLL